MTEPDSISYSFRILVSVNALPFSKRRCVSCGGAESEDLATSAFRSATVSVSWAVTVMLREGLRDFTVREMEVSEHVEYERANTTSEFE